MPKKTYYIERVLNNNSVLVKENPNKTSILIGKGIGFGKRAKTYVSIDLGLIEKSFFNYDETLKNQLIDMINNFDEDIIEVSNEIIALAELKFGELNPHVYISLTDHISFAMGRLRTNQVISNPFHSQIQLLLLNEYEIGLKARKIIWNKFKIEIPDEEVGFIAFHINAARENVKVDNVVLEMRVYKYIINLIETEYNIKLTPRDCFDLYFVIQSYVKNDLLPLQFLIDNLKFKNKEPNLRQTKLLDQIIKYIENQTNIVLTKKQISVLNAYIEHIM